MAHFQTIAGIAGEGKKWVIEPTHTPYAYSFPVLVGSSSMKERDVMLFMTSLAIFLLSHFHFPLCMLVLALLLSILPSGLTRNTEEMQQENREKAFYFSRIQVHEYMSRISVCIHVWLVFQKWKEKQKHHSPHKMMTIFFYQSLPCLLSLCPLLSDHARQIVLHIL